MTGSAYDVGVGTDTPSVDYGPSQTFPVHSFLLDKNIYFLENVADMSELPEAGQGEEQWREKR